MCVCDSDTQSYVLNFHGRVTQASVKNFQIVHDNDGTLCSSDAGSLSTIDKCETNLSRFWGLIVYKKILRLSYGVIITYDNRKSNLR